MVIRVGINKREKVIVSEVMKQGVHKLKSHLRWHTCLISALLFLLVGCGQSSNQPTATSAQSGGTSSVDLSQKWSDTNPRINLKHIFSGEINRRGKPTGYHSRPGGDDPASARIKSISKRANKAGVYTAQVEIKDPDSGQWKQKFSSIFPDTLSHQAVIDAILYAYKNRDKGKDTPWSGPSGLGFQINGYTNRDGSINTAFPIFVDN